MSKEKEIAEEYASSLADLTVNSKPLINMLTILAEENVEHAGVIVDTVEKHLEKVQPDIKLPILYLVDSIIKNVGGAYTTKFSQSIVNMFTRTFKQVDEKVRSQMFKLRETWHDVFPATKLYQLDVKVNLIDPAWPIQAQPHPGQSNIHVNPNFLKKSATPATSTVTAAPVISEEEKMRSILAKKEQELLMLQQKKIEMQLEQTRKALEMAEKNAKKATAAVIPPALSTVTGSSMPVAMVNPVVAPVLAATGHVTNDVVLPVKARLGPPVHKPSSRIAPVSGALAGARRDPRLARQQASGRVPTLPQVSQPVNVPNVAAPVIPHIMPQAPIIAPNVFDIKPLDRATKRKNVITYEVQPDEARVNRSRRDPRLDKRSDERRERREKTRERRKNENNIERHKPDDIKRDEPRKEENNSHHIKKSDEKLFNDKNSADKYFEKIADVKKINKLPPIPKLNREEAREKDAPSPVKRKKDVKIDKKKKKDNDSSKSSPSPVSSPEKKLKTVKDKEVRTKKPKPEKAEEKPEPEVIVFKGLKNYHKERYMRRNKEKSESPEPQKMETDVLVEDSSNVAEPVEAKDVDLRVLPTVLPTVEPKPAAVGQKRSSTETAEGKAKRNKIDKFDILFGNEDVDLRQLPQVEETIPHKSPKHKTDSHEDRNPSPWEDRDLRVTQSPREDRDHRVLLSPKDDQDRRVKVTPMEDRDLRVQVSPKEPQDRRVIMSSKEDVDRRVKVTTMEDRDLRVQVLPRKDRDHRRQVSPPEDEDRRVAITSKDRDLRRQISSEEDQEKVSGKSKNRDQRRQVSPEEEHDRRVLVTPQPDQERSPKDTVHSSPREERNRVLISPKKDWNEVKEKEEVKKTPTKLDLAKAKLHKATTLKDSKDRLGRPFLFSKSPSVEKERRRTISTEDLDLRTENPEEFDAEDHKKTINIIMNQAKEQFTDGQLDKNQYNTLMYQVLQLNEKLKLKEAKQRESLELSKRKLHKAAHLNKQRGVASPKSSPNAHNNFGDVDERVMPAVFMDTPPDSQGFMQDSDMRMNMMDTMDAPRPALLPLPSAPTMPGMYNMPYGNWRGPRPRSDEYVPRRFRGPLPPPFFRQKFDKRVPRFEQRMPLQLPTPKIGMGQGECPLKPYERLETPPPLGAPGVFIPPTDFRIIEYIDHDPVKTIQIDGIPREIRYYGDTAIIMLDWDDPREIKFLPGCRRVTFDNKDSVVLNFNDPYKQVEIDDQVFDIKFGAPTRELFINGRWWECFFGGQPLGVIIEGKPRLVHLEGPLPQVDIGKEKRTDLVAGKVNLIVNATQMCPVYLDAKVQKFVVNGQFFTIRFVDALKTVLINEQPFQVAFGDLPKPITIGNEKFFIRFSALPRNVKPGYINIANMEGCTIPALMPPVMPMGMGVGMAPMNSNAMEIDEEIKRPPKTPSPEGESRGLDMLASVMPSNMALEAPSSATEYCSAEPLFLKPDKIPGLETSPQEEKPTTSLPILGNINVTDLFAKLLATGIVQMPSEDKTKKEEKGEEKTEVVKAPPKEDKTKIHKVDLLRSETLKVKQPGLVAKLYGGMQCSGCGARFPPEHTVRYSQHLDWHFRQNRRERDSARRAHSRHWHYDLSDWVQYEEVEDLEEREKSWFETGGAEGEGEGPPEVPEETPSVAAGAPADHHCALCGDKFDQFYNEDKEEWHLRNSVRHEEKNYHPMCFEDYKASLTKEEEKKELSLEVVSLDKEDEEDAIAIDADEVNSQSDNESVVEVVEPEAKPEEPPVEIDEGEEDDVVLKAEPIEEVEVKDDVDTDDELAEERRERDRRAEIDFSKVKEVEVKDDVDTDDELAEERRERDRRAEIDFSKVKEVEVKDDVDTDDELAEERRERDRRAEIDFSKVKVKQEPVDPGKFMSLYRKWK
ncbi:hypothetical protein O0L34_g9148 [Tuta absoluta]|nr:hypothetical protein O0L34_g9148 [Tuta absoluta]